MANNLNLNYSTDNEYLPQNLRTFIGQTNKILVQTFDAYFTLFDEKNKFVLFNNWIAAKFASGWTRFNLATVQSGVAPRLLKIKVSKTVGKVYYQAPENSEIKVDEILPTDYLSKVLFQAFDKSERTGRCLMALYKSQSSDPYIECYDAFRHEIDFDNQGKIIFAKMFMVALNDEVSTFAKYFIVEKRYFKDGKPYQKITVRYQSYANEDESKVIEEIEEVENKDIPDWLIKKFSGVIFNQEQQLEGYTDLGVYHIDSTAVNSKFPDSKIPEAMFIDALDTIVMAEQGLTDKEVEKEIGRGQILIPEFGKEYQAPMVGNIPKTQGAIAMMAFAPLGKKNPVIQKYPTRSMEDSKPQNVQFEFRPDQWAVSVNDDIARLCAITGISILDYDPRLLQTGQRTDDEINAMTDITAQTVTTTRNLNEFEVNKLLACLCALYGLEKPVKIRWSMATIINPTKNALRVTGLYNSQLISKKQALRELYPDLNENELNQIYNEIKEETSYNPEKEIINDYNNF